MFLPYQALVHDVEYAVEYWLGEVLTPGTGEAQFGGEFELEVGVSNRMNGFEIAVMLQAMPSVRITGHKLDSSGAACASGTGCGICCLLKNDIHHHQYDDDEYDTHEAPGTHEIRYSIASRALDQGVHLMRRYDE